jgi:hypothetical protein
LFASMLIGALLAQSRSEARLQVCLSHLNQIGQTMQQYFTDFNDQFPFFATYEYAANLRTRQTWFYGGRYPPIATDADRVPPETRFLPEERPFNAYLYPGMTGPGADLPIYRCPSDDGIRWTSPAEYDAHLAYMLTGTSYTANWWWMTLSTVHESHDGGALNKAPDYGRQMVRYKLDVKGSGEFIALYGNPLDWMIELQYRIRGWHGEAGFSELLFLDGHAAYLLTDVKHQPRYQKPEWTLWWNEPATSQHIPAQFLPPFPGIETYDPDEGA